jgi:hypothetical protein
MDLKRDLELGLGLGELPSSTDIQPSNPTNAKTRGAGDDLTQIAREASLHIPRIMCSSTVEDASSRALEVASTSLSSVDSSSCSESSSSISESEFEPQSEGDESAPPYVGRSSLGLSPPSRSKSP